eukprot:gene9681-13034_t
MINNDKVYDINNNFHTQKHLEYIRKISADTESLEYLVTQHLRMSGVYWGLTAMSIAGIDLNQEPASVGLIEWVISCQDIQSGGFGGNVHHDPHILYTLSAIQILALFDKISTIDVLLVGEYVSSLQQTDGSFAGDKWGEIDTRFTYCALSIMSLIGQLNSGKINVNLAMEYIAKCRNFDGGFGAVPGAESHAGQIFCCIGALSIGNRLDLVDKDLLGWWLAERQCDSGGLNGRPEKQADVCYSWWILSSLSILGRTSWIDCDQLIKFILNCQDDESGGISDRPGNMSDIFHAFFGIAGLSLLNYFSKDSTQYQSFVNIDPTYALPVPVVNRLGLFSQKLEPV